VCVLLHSPHGKKTLWKSMGKCQSKSRQDNTRLQDSTVHDEVAMAVKAVLGSAGELQTKVQIGASLMDLPKFGFYCIVLYERIDDKHWKCIGATETSEKSNAPSFVKTTVTDFSFEFPPRIKLILYSFPSQKTLGSVVNGNDVKLPDGAVTIGEAECSLAEVVASPTKSLSRSLDNNKGILTVFADECKMEQSMITFDLCIENLVKSPLTKNPNKARKLSFAVYRSQEESAGDENHPVVIKTETKECPVDTNGNVSGVCWSRLSVSVNALCRGERDRSILIELYEQVSGKPVSLGYCTTSLRDLEALEKEDKIEQALSDSKDTISIRSVTVDRKDSFLDYISGGLDLSLFIAIDFTKSNKDYSLPGSLHSFSDPDKPNDYVKAITAVVDILQHYDRDKRFPVYGFGARLPPSYSHCSHCFACNGDFFDPEVEGIDEVLRVYQQAATSVVLHGPTCFHEIISIVSAYAEPYADPEMDHQKYAILLILTDGVITDMKQTVNELVKASALPVSVVIIGIGDEDFGLMKILDADDQKLYSTDEHKFAERDIVQFVPFNKYKHRPLSELAAETLAEIPREVVSYFKSRGIVPYRKPKDAQYDMAADDQSGEGSLNLSDMQKQLNVEKQKFTERLGTENPEIDEFEVYQVLNEDKMPCNDVKYFNDLFTKGTRGANVLSLPRTVGPDGDKPGAKQGASGRTSPLNKSILAKSGLPSPRQSILASSIKMSDIMPCRICSKNNADTVFNPCGHSGLCSKCSTNEGLSCPVCQESLKTVNLSSSLSL
jgi:hypothetical protein